MMMIVWWWWWWWHYWYAQSSAGHVTTTEWVSLTSVGDAAQQLALQTLHSAVAWTQTPTCSHHSECQHQSHPAPLYNTKTLTHPPSTIFNYHHHNTTLNYHDHTQITAIYPPSLNVSIKVTQLRWTTQELSLTHHPPSSPSSHTTLNYHDHTQITTIDPPSHSTPSSPSHTDHCLVLLTAPLHEDRCT